jgi:hypothetical protein
VTAAIVGQVSIGQCVPTTASLVASTTADLIAKITGMLQAQIQVGLQPPTFAAQLTVVETLLAALQAQLALSISIGLPVPVVDLTVMAAAIADLQAQLSALAAFTLVLGTAGVYVITQNGDARRFGSDMQTEISKIAPSGNTVQAVTFLATEPAVFAALSKVLLTG